MSAIAIQKKIDVAHKKVSTKLGYSYGLFRPINNLDVLDEANFIANVNLTFTLSDTFTSALSWQTPVYTAYTDAAKVQEGDFLWSEDEGRTFLILSRQPHQPVLVLEMPDRVDIKTVGYGDTGEGYGPGATVFVARGLPAFVSYSSSTMGGLTPARSLGAAGVRNATIYTSLPKPGMLMGSNINDGSFSGDVTMYNYASVGNAVKITAQEFQVAE